MLQKCAARPGNCAGYCEGAASPGGRRRETAQGRGTGTGRSERPHAAFVHRILRWTIWPRCCAEERKPCIGQSQTGLWLRAIAMRAHSASSLVSQSHSDLSHLALSLVVGLSHLAVPCATYPWVPATASVVPWPQNTARESAPQPVVLHGIRRMLHRTRRMLHRMYTSHVALLFIASTAHSPASDRGRESRLRCSSTAGCRS